MPLYDVKLDKPCSLFDAALFLQSLSKGLLTVGNAPVPQHVGPGELRRWCAGGKRHHEDAESGGENEPDGATRHSGAFDEVWQDHEHMGLDASLVR